MEVLLAIAGGKPYKREVSERGQRKRVCRLISDMYVQSERYYRQDLERWKQGCTGPKPELEAYHVALSKDPRFIQARKFLSGKLDE